ncbi:hypothetical protein PR048_006708 [Dryococelus australis]|uniref:Uncharacterized protein n=1 Tax=Dryococelus australis TaxID=614101 RepID=A0ABQ9IDX5_9NEOP|nr:hypothetical protein PR048_006708 [Dryococelus australis]
MGKDIRKARAMGCKLITPAAKKEVLAPLLRRRSGPAQARGKGGQKFYGWHGKENRYVALQPAISTSLQQYLSSHLKRVLGEHLLTFGEYTTFEDPNDLEVLTPGYFLIRAPLTAAPNSLIRWQLIKQAMQHFSK